MHKHYPSKSVDTPTLYNSLILGSFKGQENEAYLENTCAIRMSYALLRSGFHLSQTADKGASLLGGDKRWYWLRVADLRQELRSRFKGFDAELKLKMIDGSLVNDFESMKPLYFARKAQVQAFLNEKLAGKNGIIVFGVKGWGNATGHFTLWDGKEMNISFGTGHDNPELASYYPWLTSLVINDKTKKKTLIQTEQIQFWELK